MQKFDGLAWGKKVYLWLSLAVVAVIWLVFFISLFFGRLSNGPVEATWFGEIMKWVIMTPVLVLIVDGISYALIGTLASRKQAGLDSPKDVEEVPQVVKEKAEEVQPVVDEVIETPAPAKKTRKKKVVEE